MRRLRYAAITVATILTVLALTSAITSATSRWVDWSGDSLWTWAGWTVLCVGAAVCGWKFGDWFDDLFSKRGRG